MLVKLTLPASCPTFPENKIEARVQGRSILWSLVDFNQMKGEVDMLVDLSGVYSIMWLLIGGNM